MPVESPSPWLVVGSIVGFILGWCMINLVTGTFGNWGRLAKTYRAHARPEGKAFHLQNITTRLFIENVLCTMVVAAEGLYIAVLPIYRMGHPPLLIPWSEFSYVRTTRFLFWGWVSVAVGHPPVAIRILLSEKVWLATPCSREQIRSPSMPVP